MIEKISIVNLNSCFMNILILVQKIRLKEQSVTLSHCIKKLDNEFRNSVNAALSMNIDIRDYDDARFAICALVDEQLMMTKWRYQNSWREHLYQKKYYGTTNAGTEYYERLLKLQSNAEAVREVYLLCLVYGFTGRYSKNSDKEQLEKLRTEELAKLADKFEHAKIDKCAIASAVVSADLREDLFGQGPVRSKFRHTVYMAVAAFITMYIIFSVILNFQFANVTAINRLNW